MSKCNWCGKEHSEKEYPIDCMMNYGIHKIRKIIFEFAQAMEKKMQEKDEKGYTHEDKSLDYLIKKLKEERDEVDFELVDLPSFEVDEELLHEAIMIMLVRHKIKNLTKEDLK